MRVGNNIGDETLIGGNKYLLTDQWKNADDVNYEIFFRIGTTDERTVIIAVRDGDLKKSFKYFFGANYDTSGGPLVTRSMVAHDLSHCQLLLTLSGA